MVRDNRDRYGYRHRRDSDYGVGESMPGETGDSAGTFHDRANQDSNVIVDGKVRSLESYRRSLAESKQGKSRKKSKPKSKSSKSKSKYSKLSSDSVSQNEVVGRVVRVKIESSGGTKQALGRYKNHQVHIDSGKPGETVQVKLKTGKGFLIGERVPLSE